MSCKEPRWWNDDDSYKEKNRRAEVVPDVRQQGNLCSETNHLVLYVKKSKGKEKII